MRIAKTIFFGVLLSISILGTAIIRENKAAVPAISPLDELRQFTAGGHVLGFRKGQMFVASGDHALKVEFVNARPVSPGEEAKSGAPESSHQTAQPLGKVSYPNLWDGVTLIYENHGAGVVKSTYRVEAGGTTAVDRVDEIRLRYNVPVKVDEGGNLIFSFPTGEMRESRPVAWQEIEGSRVPVEATYRLISDQEVGFKARSYDSRYPLVIDPVLSWNTFLGGSGNDRGHDIAVDTSGNVYVTGWSDATWGSPVRPFSGGWDTFVAKLSGSGALQWNTFLGGSGDDESFGIAVDTSGNVYVTGYSVATWGSPVNPFAAGYYDAFVAKLDVFGALQWNTFLGSSDTDWGWGIAVDTSGNVYVTGYSNATWGSPVRPYSAGSDAFAAKLNGSGVLQWNTFLGSSSVDVGQAIALDTSGNIYVAGQSGTTWGSPVRPYTGGGDAFVAKLNGSGALQWNTFLGGSSGGDVGYGIAVDTSGNVYVTGESDATWGSPVRPYSAGSDVFVVKLNGSGVLKWNTFLGGSGSDDDSAIAVDTSGNVFVAGYSTATWGSPVSPLSGSMDAFVAKLSGSGTLQWNTFLGGSSSDYGNGIAVDTSGNVYVTGASNATWGSPVRPFSGTHEDAFVAKLSSFSSRKVDFNGDGKEDIVWRHYGTGQNAVWFMGGYTGTGGALGDSILQGFGEGVRAADMKQDRAPKVYREIAEVGGLLGNPAGTMYFDPQEALAFNARHGSGDIYLIQAQMAASGSPQYLSPAMGPRKQTQNIIADSYLPFVTDVNWTLVGTGDFNGDGKTDILWQNYSTGQNAVWFMNGVSNTGSTYLPTVIDLNWKIVGTGDFNSDGQIDILWRNNVTGQNAVWFMNGATYISYAYLPAVTDTNWQIAGTGDLNGDGQIDILWRNYLTGQNAAWGMNGITETSNAYLPPVTDTNWRIMGTGDFNGDGKVDIIWRNSLNGQNVLWYMNGITYAGYDSLPTVTDTQWRISNR